MRKWMRDRLKRPKKNAEAGKAEPAQAPLQPAYYDAPDTIAPAAPIRIAEAEVPPPAAEPQPFTTKLRRRVRRSRNAPQEMATRAAADGGAEADEAAAERRERELHPSPRHRPK